MSESRYYVNIAKMTIMWSTASGLTYVLMFLNKYFEGDIYQNNYVD